MVARGCTFEKPDGKLCRATPMHDAAYCFWHNPATAEDLADAQRLGGVRRKRERIVAGAYDFTGLSSVESITRLLEIAVFDALALDNSLARCRTLISAALAGAKLLETGDLQARLELLEAASRSRRSSDPSGDVGGALDGAA